MMVQSHVWLGRLPDFEVEIRVLRDMNQGVDKEQQPDPNYLLDRSPLCCVEEAKYVGTQMQSN